MGVSSHSCLDPGTLFVVKFLRPYIFFQMISVSYSLRSKPPYSQTMPKFPGGDQADECLVEGLFHAIEGERHVLASVTRIVQHNFISKIEISICI